MAAKTLTIAEVLTQLAETPRRLAELTAGLRPAQLRASPGGEEWSANEVLAHLRSCADVWGKSIATILAEDRPRIRAVNPRAWIKTTNYPGLEFAPSLRAYTEQRAGLLSVLESMPPAGWTRAATVTGTGQVVEWTVLFYTQRMAMHEGQHVDQVRSIVTALRAAGGSRSRPLPPAGRSRSGS